MANIVIGILAHNEADRIAPTIASLFKQEAFRGSQHRVEVVLVANGCKDATEGVAADAAEQSIRSEGLQGLTSFSVMSIPTPGKCHAWNAFAHSSYVTPNCLVGLMDADISLPAPSTITDLADDLLRAPELRVAVSRPIKHFAASSTSWVARALSRGVSGNDPSTICGQLYLTREEVIRDLWLPNRLQVEDGFLRAMIVTDQFRNPDEAWRVRWSNKAYHYYDPYLQLGQLTRHETWLVSNAAVCAQVYGELWRRSAPESPAGPIIKSLNDSSPDWVEQLLKGNLGDKKLVIPKSILTRRLARLRDMSWAHAAKRLPAALAATVLDWIVYYQSNRRVLKWIRTGDMRTN